MDNGNLFGVYELVREIAAGGTSTVWEAQERACGRRVALKVLHQHLAMDPNFLQRFQREADIAAALEHPNIVAVYDSGAYDGRNFISMEYIDGVSLEFIISLRKNIPLPAAARLALSVAGALDYSHGRSVIHRDVKPGNILLSKDGAVKVTDFGFSRIINSPLARLTMVNRVVGTPLFMAPEMIAGRQATFSSDLFSLGIVLYYLACGCPPFSGATMPAVMQKIMECNYVNPRKLDRKIPKSLEKIIVFCLQKDPDSRYGSMGAMIDDLKDFIEECSPETGDDSLAAIVCACIV
jgi:serine/threonine-protein kinase